jgi:uncharacterized surface anchored protein
LKVTATFAASHGSHGSFKENDQITVSWTLAKPEDKDKAYVEGFPDGMDLKIEGQVVGHYSVTPNGTVLTFNKNIENFPNKQSGDFTFYVTARNLKSEDQTLEIIYDKTKVVPITVAGTPKRQDPEPTGEGWGGSKVGSLRRRDEKSPLYILWGIYLNSNAAKLDDSIDVNDDMPAGTILDESSIYFEIDGQNYSLSDFKNRFPKSKIINISENNLHLELSKDEFSGRKAVVGYNTTVIDGSKENYTNTADVSYTLRGGTRTKGNSDYYTKTVKNLFLDAHVYGTKPNELKIVKLDADTSEPIAGVKFEITDPNGKTKTYSTNEQGIIDLMDVASGTYSVQETEAAKGYILDSKKQEINISGKAGIATVFKNKKQTSIPWEPLTPAKETKPWTPLTPAKETKPWTPLTPAKETKPWTPLTPAKETKPWTPLTPAKETKPWEPLTPAKPVEKQEEEKSEISDSDSSVVISGDTDTQEVPVKSEEDVPAWESVQAKPMAVALNPIPTTALAPLAQNSHDFSTAKPGSC